MTLITEAWSGGWPPPVMRHSLLLLQLIRCRMTSSHYQQFCNCIKDRGTHSLIYFALVGDWPDNIMMWKLCPFLDPILEIHPLVNWSLYIECTGNTESNVYSNMMYFSPLLTRKYPLLGSKKSKYHFILHHCQTKPWLRRGERSRTSMWADQAGTVLNIQELWIYRSLTSDHF